MTLSSDNRVVRMVAGTFCVLLFACGTAAQADPSYVLRDGRKVELDVSATELAVVLDSPASADAFAERMEENGLAVATIEGHEGSRVRLVEVPDTGAAQREALLADAAVVEVQRVLRFAGVEVPAITSGTIAVKLASGLNAEERAAVLREHGLRLVRTVDGLPDVFLLAPVSDDIDELTAAEALADDARTVWAHPNLRRPARTLQLNVQDPFFGQQWHLHNTGQRGGTDDADIDALEAWEITEGEGVLFGMFDDSCDVDHEDLRNGYIGIGHNPAVDRNAPGSDDPRPKEFFDFHGTSVMGLACAQANELGGRGVAPRAKFTASRGLTEIMTAAQAASVYLFALRQNVDVHINSWSLFGPTPPILEDAVSVAFTSGRNVGDIDGDGIEDRLGMVIVFASGNGASRMVPGFGMGALPEVIAVGASLDNDQRSVFSNFGDTLSFLAPSHFGFPAGHAGIFTTDVTDRPGEAAQGLNIGGFNIGNGELETDESGSYTDFFGGTSASCPIAAGVAGLILSVNPLLSATDVRLIMEHTTDRIRPGDADYDPVTSHSETYGYGRINARRAVEAAQTAEQNDGRTWPDAPLDVRPSLTELRWRQSVGADEFLVLQSNTAFAFIPEDGACYSAAQSGCGQGALQPLPAGVQVVAAGCNLTCGTSANGGCDCGVEQCVSFPRPETVQHFAIFARNQDGLYSFGVTADTDRNVRGEARILDEDHPSCTNAPATGPPAGRPSAPPPAGPNVTPAASPLSGRSPLTVTFRGNAVTSVPIDDSRTAWDFDTSDGVPVDATTRNATHTYVADPGQTRQFVARLTMFDVNGNVGSGEVTITVQGPPVADGTGFTGDARILAGLPASPGSNVTQGRSPLTVLLTLDAAAVTGPDQLRSISVNWDLGDGTRSSGLSVLHTYVNETEEPIRIPITATVSLTSTEGATFTTTTTRLLTVTPGTARPDEVDPVLPGQGAQGPGGTAAPCGAISMIPGLLLLGGLWMLRRRK